MTKPSLATSAISVKREIDLAPAMRFLDFLAPDETHFVFQTFDDNQQRKAQHAEEIKEENKRRKAAGERPLSYR